MLTHFKPDDKVIIIKDDKTFNGVIINKCGGNNDRGCWKEYCYRVACSEGIVMNDEKLKNSNADKKWLNYKYNHFDVNTIALAVKIKCVKCKSKNV